MKDVKGQGISSKMVFGDFDEEGIERDFELPDFEEDEFEEDHRINDHANPLRTEPSHYFDSLYRAEGLFDEFEDRYMLDGQPIADYVWEHRN